MFVAIQLISQMYT